MTRQKVVTREIQGKMRSREGERRVGRDTGINNRKKESQIRDVEDTRTNRALSCLTVQAVRFPMEVQQSPSHHNK